MQPAYESVDDSRPVPNYTTQYITDYSSDYSTDYSSDYTASSMPLPAYPQAKRARNMQGFFISLNMLLCLVIVWVLIFGINNALHGQPVEDAPIVQPAAGPSVDDATAPDAAPGAAPDAAPGAALDVSLDADSSTRDLPANEALPFGKATVSRE